MLEQLNKEERLRLVRFVCSFAWADLSLKSEERDYVSRLVARLQLSQEEQAQVQTWLDTPPAAAERAGAGAKGYKPPSSSLLRRAP